MVLQHLSELWGLQLLALYYLSLSSGAFKFLSDNRVPSEVNFQWSVNESLFSAATLLVTQRMQMEPHSLLEGRQNLITC